MPAAPSSFARLRFAPAGLTLRDLRESRESRESRELREVGASSREAPRPSSLDLPREEGLALLEWLGLGRPEFGAIGGRELAPRCRRRLWDIARNAHPQLRARATELLAVAETAGEGMVLFG